MNLMLAYRAIASFVKSSLEFLLEFVHFGPMKRRDVKLRRLF